MKRFTVDDVLKLDYCSRYDPAAIRRLWGKRESATALDILDSHIQVEDRLWLVFELDILNQDTTNHFRAALAFFAADIYEKYYPDDSRVRDCAVAWLETASGRVVDLASARAAARAAAWDAAWADMVVWLRDIIEIHEVQP